MANFLEAIQNKYKEIESNNSGNYEDDNEFPRTKNDPMFFGSKTPEMTLRILPSLGLLQGDPSADLGTPARSLYVRATTSTGKDMRTNIVMDLFKNNNSVFESNIPRWTDEGKLKVGSFNSRPRVTYWVNAIPLVENQNDNFDMELNQDGTPKVVAVQLPQSAYNEIMRNLADRHKQPITQNGQAPQMSFIGIDVASPVHIVKPSKGSTEKTYRVEVYNQYALPQLDVNTIGNALDDFKSVTEPYETSMPTFVQSVISWIDGVDANTNSATGVTPVRQSTGYTQEQFSQAVPDPFQGNQAPQQNYQQPVQQSDNQPEPQNWVPQQQQQQQSQPQAQPTQNGSDNQQVQPQGNQQQASGLDALPPDLAQSLQGFMNNN